VNGDFFQGDSDGMDESMECAGGQGSEGLFDLGPHLFDGIEVRAVGRQIPQLGSDGFDEFPDAWMLVAGKVVQDDYLAPAERGKKNLFDIDQKRFGVDGAFQRKGGLNAIEPNRRDHRCRLPVSGRRLGQQTLPLPTPAVQTHHVRLGPAFIDETKAMGIDLVGALPPLDPGLFYVRSVLLGGPERFFYTAVSAVPTRDAP
jgi:hypothetical protein